MDPVLLLAGGVAVYVWLQSRGVLPSMSAPLPHAGVTPPNLAGVPPDSPSGGSRAGMATTIIGGVATLAPFVAGGSGAAATGAGAAGVGMSGAAIAATAGIAAGGVLLTWAIAQKGLFRGGWEGIRGNRIRDVFLQQFVDIYYPGAGSERQYDAMVKAFVDIGEAHRAEGMIGVLYRADGENAMKTATRAIADLFVSRGVPISAPRF
jgi:hypothetical protein